MADQSEEPGASQIVRAAPGATVYAVLNGDIHIRNGSPVYRFERIDHDVHPVDPTTARSRPSTLLSVSREVVGFHGRDREMAELVAWRDDAEVAFSTLLLHAPGGQGKSRIAAQLARLSAQEGWTTWTAHHLSDPTGQQVVVPGAPGGRLLLVVDYADRWPLDDLLLLLDNPVLRAQACARVLLLARGAGPWWPALRHRLGKQGRPSTRTVRLAALATDPQDRRTDFGTAHDAYAQALGLPAAAVPVPRAVEDESFSVALNLQMAALVVAHSRVRGGAAISDPIALSRYLLDRENDFWHATLDHREEPDRVDPPTMARTVHVAALTGAVGESLGRTVVERLGVGPAQLEAGHVLRAHSELYPPLQPDGSTVLEPLRPDRLAEDFLALRTGGHGVDDHEPDAWAGPALSTLLTHRDTQAVRRQVMIQLIEVGKRWPHVRLGHLYPALRRQPGLAIESGGAGLAELAEFADMPGSLREAVIAFFPPHRHLELDVGIAHFVRRSFSEARTTPIPATACAELCMDVGGRLAFADLDEDAVEFAREAVAAARRVPTGSTLLARCLHNLGEIQGRMADPEGALPALDEAVDEWRRHDGPAALSGLRNSLASRSHLQSGMGRASAALADAEDAIRLIEPRPTTREGLYETSRLLILYGMRLGETGEPGPGAEAVEHGVTAMRIVARAEPERYQEQLAEALTTWGELLAALHEHGSSLSTFDEAVTHARAVARLKGRPERVLASALAGRAAAAAAAGHPDRGIFADEAVAHQQSLESNLPRMTHIQYLAHAMDLQAAALEAQGRDDSALPLRRDMVEMRREVHRSSPGAGRRPLIVSLNHLSRVARRLGLADDALSSSTECLQLGRAMANDLGSAYDQELTMLMRSFVEIRGSVDVSEQDVRDAIDVYGELIRLGGALVERLGPDPHAESLAAAIVDATRFMEAVDEIDELAAVATSDHARDLRALVARASASSAPPGR